MIETRIERRRILSIGTLFLASLLIVFCLAGMVSADCGGSSEVTYSSSNLFTNWMKTDDPGLDNQILQENILIEKDQQEKLQLVKTLQDKTLDPQVQQQKIADQNKLDQKIAQETADRDNLVQQKSTIATV